MTVDIVFSVTGYVKQTVELDDKYTPKQLIEMLDNGVACTTIQEGGAISLCEDKRGFVSIGHVVCVDNCCEYEDFEIEEEY